MTVSLVGLSQLVPLTGTSTPDAPFTLTQNDRVPLTV